MSIETQVEKFILDELLLGGGPEGIDPKESLMESGLINSLSMLRMVAFIEEQFEIRIEDHELLPEDFETLVSIRNFVEQKKLAGGA